MKQHILLYSLSVLLTMIPVTSYAEESSLPNNYYWTEKPVVCGLSDDMFATANAQGFKAAFGGIAIVSMPDVPNSSAFSFLMINPVTDSYIMFEVSSDTTEACVVANGRPTEFDLKALTKMTTPTPK